MNFKSNQSINISVMVVNIILKSRPTVFWKKVIFEKSHFWPLSSILYSQVGLDAEVQRFYYSKPSYIFEQGTGWVALVRIR
jgi:hypothetical protein